MKSNAILYILITSFTGLLLCPGYAFPVIVEPTVNKYKTISATACDSLIKANEQNPDFVILDVRTSDVWKSDHLSGSINRNYYDADFDSQLNLLAKKKIFLLHCQSGGRSAPTLLKMKTLNFAEVYEMSGGINLWKSKSLPTTNILAPKLMLVSNGGIKNGTVTYGIADTLRITITNRANDVLKFTSLTLPEGNEFSSDFDLNKNLNGSEDYTFSVYYKPLLPYRDLVNIGMASNGGTLNLNVIIKKGTSQEIKSFVQSQPEIFPNPATDYISFKSVSGTTFQEVSLVNMKGQLVKREQDFSTIDQLNIADLPKGIYLLRLVTNNRTFDQKLIICR
jgi:phage shock protein E